MNAKTLLGESANENFGIIRQLIERKGIGVNLKKLVLIACIASALGLNAGTEAGSASTFIYVDTAESSFWRTATNNIVELSIDYPATATSASLSVAGSYGYSFETNNVAEGRFRLELPSATSPETEDVYDLVISFDDGTVRNARFGVIAGVSDRPEGSARCECDGASPRWGKVRQRAVLPVPFGATALSVGGETVATGLDGAQGWYAYGPLAVGSSETVCLTMPGGAFEILLRSVGSGMSIRIQ